MEEHDIWIARCRNAKARADLLREQWEEEQETIRTLVVQLYQLSPLTRGAIAAETGFSLGWINKILTGVGGGARRKRRAQPGS